MSENTHCPCCLLSYGVFINFEKSDLFDVKSSFFHGSCLVLTHNPQGRWCVVRRNQATVTKEANLEDKTEQKFHRLIVFFIIIHVLLVCWRSNQLAAKKGLKFCELAWARRTEKKFDFSECDMLWRPAVGRRGGGGFFSFSRLPSQPFSFLTLSFRALPFVWLQAHSNME